LDINFMFEMTIIVGKRYKSHVTENET
jgi:hypothetical protein